MVQIGKTLPSGNEAPSQLSVQFSTELGDFARKQRLLLGLTQEDLAGLSNTGNRFIVDLEKGKPTLQLQRALDVLHLLGLEVVLRVKSAGSPQ